MNADDASRSRLGLAWPGEGQSHAALRAAWFAKIRWGAFAAQMLAVAAGTLYLDFNVPEVPLVALAGVTAVTNLWLTRLMRRGIALTDPLGAALLSLDVLVLTALLYLAGGHSNPFSVLFLVEITIAALILGSRWTWFVAALSMLCYGALFLLPHSDIHMSADETGLWSYSFHLEGMALALCAAAVLTAYFASRLSRAIEARDVQIAGMREAAARRERLSALTTLAAGAAHELGTPLSTITLAARELEHAIGRIGGSHAAALLEDARLIRAEVERCRHIVEGMSPSQGADVGETSVRLAAGAVVADAVAQLSAADAARVRVAVDVGPVEIIAPPRALVSTIVNLVRNAIDASPGQSAIQLVAAVRDDTLRFTVRDSGPGMSAEVLAHAGEPFFTTKTPGQGMGLGLFLARTLADRLGGRLELESRPGAGTSATIEIPVNRAPEDEHVRTT